MSATSTRSQVFREARKTDVSSFKYALLLIVLWLIFNLNRVFSGYDLISDEIFYFTASIEMESRRRYFLWLVQSFPDQEVGLLAVSIVNITAIIFSFFLLSIIFFRNQAVAFFQTIYFSAIAAYAFRDSIILLMVSIVIYTFIAGKGWRRAAVISAVLILLLDFRIQYVLLFAAAFAVAWFSTRIKNDLMLATLILGACTAAVVYSSLIGSNFKIYGITLTEYIQLKEDRWEYVLTPVSFLYGLVVHYFAPIPTSLVQRILGLSTELSPYGILDDIYRMIYKCYVYVAWIYLLLNLKRVKEVFQRWRFLAVFLTTFCLLNASVYAIVSFAGSHERTKIFSTLFLSFLLSGVLHLKAKTADGFYTKTKPA